MKHLSHAILEDYDIPLNAPRRLCAVQFGDDALLMGLVDRLIDDANRDGADIGIAVVQSGETGHAAALAEQDGMFTTFVRGDLNEKEVRREQVVQSVLKALEPEADSDALMELARDAGIRFALLHEDETGEFAQRNAICAALAARFLIERHRAGLEGMAIVVCGDSEECAANVRARIAGVIAGWGEDAAWLENYRFLPAVADCMVERSTPAEAARLCSEMNYADAMIHIAEPYGLWAIQADAAFREEFPMAGGQIVFVDDLAPVLLKKHRLFDSGLFAMAGLGALHGDSTLAECMKDEPLRERVGHALMEELLPFVPLNREEAAQYIIACCERWENPLNENRIFDVGAGLLRRFCVGVLPAMRAYADEHFAPPPHLTLALAAFILVYASVRHDGEAYQAILDGGNLPIHDDTEALAAFSLLSPDMPADSLAYAVLADRSLWRGADLREIEGLEDALSCGLQTEFVSSCCRADGD